MEKSSINENGWSCHGEVTYDARSIGIIGAEMWEFEFTSVEELGLIEGKDIYLMFLYKVQKLRTSLSDTQTVPEENLEINYGDWEEEGGYLIWWQQRRK